MKAIIKLAAVSVLALSAVTGAAQAAELTFPDPEDGVISLQYGDFTVYSLAMLNYYATNGSTSQPSSGDPYYLPSAPGQINSSIVIATSPGGINNNEFANTDNPFSTPTGGGNNSFWTTAGNEPNPTFTGDNAGTWDISIETLRGYLGNKNMYFGFNLNETDGGNSLLDEAQDALAWGKVTLVNLSSGAEVSFIFDGTNANPIVESQTLYTYNGIDWGHIHGQICVAKVSDSQPPELLHLGACTGADTNGVTINQNLGADRAAFALTNAELNDLIYSNQFDIMRVELGLYDINNGYEQLFIFASGDRTTTVPEPAAIGLLGLGALAIGAARRRRKAA